MGLMLHVNANTVDYDDLRRLDTPPATPSHVPIPHFRVVDLLRTTLGMFGHEIIDEHHGITEDGSRYFGLLSLRSTYGGYEDTVGCATATTRASRSASALAAGVFVCDNLAFLADTVIKRKHTANLKRDLPGIIGEIIEPLADQRDRQHRSFERYRGTMLTDERADHAVMNMYRNGIINVQRIPEVLREWEEPSFEDFNERNAWRLFNAATFALTGRVVENANVTPRLHQVIDGVCERVN